MELRNKSIRQPGCICNSNFTETWLEDNKQQTSFYHVSATEGYVIAAGEDNYLRVWSRKTTDEPTTLFRLRMPENILAIGMSHLPLRIYISTKEQVKSYTVEKEPDTSIITKIGGVKKIRFQQDLLILSSQTDIAGFKFVEDDQSGQPWGPQFHLTGESFIDALLVRKTKLVVLAADSVLSWTIYNYSNQSVTFKEHREFQLNEDNNVLDTSDVGLCLISSPSSGVCVLDLMKQNDNPAQGLATHWHDNYSGIGCFLRPCDKGHQPPFLFSGDSYLEWTIRQKVQNGTEVSEDGMRQEEYLKILGRQFQSHPSIINAVFPSCHSYSSGVALIWDSKCKLTISAVILLEYTEQKGNCRLYDNYDGNDGYYSPPATGSKYDHVHRALLDGGCGVNSTITKFAMSTGDIALLEQVLRASRGILWSELMRMAVDSGDADMEKVVHRHIHQHRKDGIKMCIQYLAVIVLTLVAVGHAPW